MLIALRFKAFYKKIIWLIKSYNLKEVKRNKRIADVYTALLILFN